MVSLSSLSWIPATIGVMALQQTAALANCDSHAKPTPWLYLATGTGHFDGTAAEHPMKPR